jgi:hypothetical protein
LQKVRWNDERGFAMLHLRLDLLALAAVSGCGIGFFIWTVYLLLTKPRTLSAGEQARFSR